MMRLHLQFPKMFAQSVLQDLKYAYPCSLWSLKAAIRKPVSIGTCRYKSPSDGFKRTDRNCERAALHHTRHAA